MIKWSNLRAWEIVLFWAIISATVVSTVVLADYVREATSNWPYWVIVPQFGMIDPCYGQGPLCVAA